MRAPVLFLAFAAGLAACAPADEQQEPREEASATGEAPLEQDEDGRPSPESFGETAWLARAPDGARFATFFDSDGTYRDLRNGDPWQSGEWSYAEGPEGKQLCFKPADEGGVERCWQPDSMKGDVLLVLGPEGKRVELERIAYEAPDAAGDVPE